MDCDICWEAGPITQVHRPVAKHVRFLDHACGPVRIESLEEGHIKHLFFYSKVVHGASYQGWNGKDIL